ncbi:hypothetical protein VB636_01510, partial [Paracoccus sp. APAP_BH8]|uniref:hypothetical protein n=1 Tax=Paracoccus sp. APAP_BH8 TaxID=3110237 RepID=UPI002FD871A3
MAKTGWGQSPRFLPALARAVFRRLRHGPVLCCRAPIAPGLIDRLGIAGVARMAPGRAHAPSISTFEAKVACAQPRIAASI